MHLLKNKVLIPAPQTGVAANTSKSSAQEVKVEEQQTSLQLPSQFSPPGLLQTVSKNTVRNLNAFNSEEPSVL